MSQRHELFRHAEVQGGIQRNSEISRRRFHLTDFLVYLFSLIVLAGIFKIAGKEGLQNIASPRLGFLLLAVFLTYLFMEGLARRYEAALGLVVSGNLPPHLSILYSTAFGMTAGLVFSRGLGQVLAKPALLKDRDGFSLSQGVYASIMERMMDLSTGIILSLPLICQSLIGFEPFPRFHLIFWVGLYIAWGSLAIRNIHAVFKAIQFIFSIILNALKRLKIKKILDLIENIQLIDDQISYLSISKKKYGIRFVLWSQMKPLLMTFRIWCLASSFSISIPFDTFLLGLPVVQLGLLLAFTPGSLGFLEAGWLAVLSFQGISQNEIFTFLLILRLANYLFFPMLTLLLWCFSWKRKAKTK